METLISDYRKKEVLNIKRRGGDLEFLSRIKRDSSSSLFGLKSKDIKKTEKLMEEIKSLLKRQL